MNKPVILFRSVATESNVTATTSLAGYPAAAAVTPFTYESWRFDQSGSLTIDAGQPVEADALGMILHGLRGGTVMLLGSSDDVGYTLLGSFVAGEDRPYLLLLAQPETWRYWRVAVEFSSDDLGAVGIVPVLMVGRRLEFERCMMGQHAPITLNRRSDFSTNESGTGQFLGRSVIRRNVATQAQFSMLSAPWARQEFQAFVRHAREKPYFFSWKPEKYPDECAYVWTDEDIGVDYTGDGSLMSAAWPMRGLGPID